MADSFERENLSAAVRSQLERLEQPHALSRFLSTLGWFTRWGSVFVTAVSLFWAAIAEDTIGFYIALGGLIVILGDALARRINRKIQRDRLRDIQVLIHRMNDELERQ